MVGEGVGIGADLAERTHPGVDPAHLNPEASISSIWRRRASRAASSRSLGSGTFVPTATARIAAASSCVAVSIWIV
jgi:hypothetical protein